MVVKLMVKSTLSLVCALAFSVALAGSAAAQDRMGIFVGESRVIKTEYDLGNMLIANPDVAIIKRASDREVAVVGKGPGVTDVTLWDQQGKKRAEIKVVVGAQDMNLYAEQVKSLLGEIEGMTVRVVGDSVVIDGEVLRDDDLERIGKVVGATPKVVNLVKLNPVTKDVLAKKIQETIAMKGVTARVVKDSIVLEGVVYSKTSYEKAEKLAKAYSQSIVNALEIREMGRNISAVKTVQVKATFIEVSRSMVDELGINWSPGISIDGAGQGVVASGSPASWVGTIVGTISSVFPKIRAASAKGGVRVLEEPTISTKSGEKASLFSGGEIAFSVVQGTGERTMEWKPFGVTLVVEPVVVDDKTVDLKLEVEVSALGKMSAGAPTIHKSTIKTSQVVRANESVAIGGLMSSADRKTFNKVPEGQGSGSLWQLVRSKDFQEDRSELVVFITTTILADSADAQKDLKERVEKKYEAFDTDLR